MSEFAGRQKLVYERRDEALQTFLSVAYDEDCVHGAAVEVLLSEYEEGGDWHHEAVKLTVTEAMLLAEHLAAATRRVLERGDENFTVTA